MDVNGEGAPDRPGIPPRMLEPVRLERLELPKALKGSLRSDEPPSRLDAPPRRLEPPRRDDEDSWGCKSDDKELRFTCETS
jgi:hypothetical protein